MWILILVMIGADNPNIMTIPVEEYPTQEICEMELELLTEAAQDDTGQAALVCLRDARPEPIDIELKPFDDGMQYPADDSMIIVKAMDMKLEPGIIMSGA
jgi:hypothetical protein